MAVMKVTVFVEEIGLIGWLVPAQRGIFIAALMLFTEGRTL